jgi:hypothetical protein
MPRKRSEADTVQISVRAKEPLRRQLQEAAEERGVSMNVEIIDRLQRSFDSERTRFEEVFGSREIYGVMRTIAAAIHETGLAAGFGATRSQEGAAGWLKYPFAYDQAVKAAIKVFDALRPEGDPSPPAHLSHIPNLGGEFASGILDDVARGAARVTPANDARTEELRRELGPLADRLKPSETAKEARRYTVQRDDQHQVMATGHNKKPEGDIE